MWGELEDGSEELADPEPGTLTHQGSPGFPAA